MGRLGRCDTIFSVVTGVPADHCHFERAKRREILPSNDVLKWSVMYVFRNGLDFSQGSK